MSQKSKFKSGMVSIVGRPNVGKSTLLNQIVGEKISIVSKIPQTTRQQIRGIYNDERGQIVFIDTPGVHVGRDNLDKYMNSSSEGTLDSVDAVIYLVDTSRRPGEEEGHLARKICRLKCPVIFGLNKVDFKKGALIPDYVAFLEKISGKSVGEMPNITLLPLSGAQGINVDKMLDLIFDVLPEGPALYPIDVLTDLPKKIAIADIVREKLFNLMHAEVPHALGVMVEHLQAKRTNTTHIKVVIFVVKETHKEIVIGKNGSILKKVGTLARIELEELLETKVFLECFVRIEKNWRDDLGLLAEQGFDARDLM